MAEADHSAVWAVLNAIQREITRAQAEGSVEKITQLQRRSQIWALKAIALERVRDPAALAEAALKSSEPGALS
jgi:hypothetical protein